MRHQNWRDLQEWKAEGLVLSTASNEASKLYDAAVTQIVGWYDEPQLNGLGSTLEKLYAADPNFVLGRAFSAGLQLLCTGDSVQTNSVLKNEINELQSYLENSSNRKLTDHETDHVLAVLHWAKGDLWKAASVWERVLTDYPTDIHALKFLTDTYFFLGASTSLRDSVARVLPIWESKCSIPLKSYVHGMAAFGLEESNMYERAEKEAKKGLELNPLDGWSTHSLAHVYEMQGSTAEGIHFLNSTVNDWTTCNFLACHNYWHLALYHVEREEFDEALNVFDQQLSPRAVSSKSMLDIVDVTSLLYRLQLADYASQSSLKERWSALYEICEPHLDDQILGFNDAHFLMGCIGSGATSSTTKFMTSCSSRTDAGTNYKETIHVTEAILRAMLFFQQEQYESAVDILNGVRSEIIKIGGSHAQRDVFHQLLIASAIKSNKKAHHKLALALLRERKYLKDVSPLTDRYCKMHEARNKN